MQKTKRTRTRETLAKVTQKRKAVDLLYQKMMFYSDKAKFILEAIIKDMDCDEKADAKTRIKAFALLKEADQIAIDCAVKLAPFQSPKLESVEVNNKIEHRYVMRAPAQFKSTEDWMKATGASENEQTEEIKPITQPTRLNIHDMEDYDETEDERRSIN